MKFQIEYVKRSELKEFENNPKLHEGEQILLIADSIKRYGFINPIIVDKDNVIIAGHCRIAAARTLNMDEVPIIRAEHLTPEQVEIFRVLDNKSVELSPWRDDQLEIIFNRLSEEDRILTGFDDDEINKILKIHQEAEEDNFELPKEPKYKVQRGEVYQLGQHRLMCGDSTSEQDVNKLMNGNKVDMVFTDPPYAVSIGKKNRDLQSMGIADRNTQDIEGDDLDIDTISKNIWQPAFLNISKSLKEGSGYYVTAPQGGDQMMMMMMMMQGSMRCRHELIWVKSSPTFSMGRLDYSYQHEPILYGWIGKNRRFYGVNERSVWYVDKAQKCKLHPTMKPIELCSIAIKNSSLNGEIVLDIFGGSGSTLIACEQLNRKCYMMEIDPFYISVILERWEKLTGLNHIKL